MSDTESEGEQKPLPTQKKQNEDNDDSDDSDDDDAKVVTFASLGICKELCAACDAMNGPPPPQSKSNPSRTR